MHRVKDPVCGMLIDPANARAVEYQGRTYSVCSDLCQRTFLADPDTYAGRAAELAAGTSDASRRLAYFSMEVGIDPRMPTYSGGLGILAGDTLRACADLKLPMVAVSLLYKNGYFDQQVDEHGYQHESPVAWEPAQIARLLPTSIQVSIQGRAVRIHGWQYDIIGITGHHVPLILLDTNVDENDPDDRALTAWLYGGDERYRLAQEILLGIGGVRMLRALGFEQLERIHMNEGHSSFLVLELLREQREKNPDNWDFNGVRDRCVFTTHTPVPAGHDQFSYELVKEVWSEPIPLEILRMLGGEERLNMTRLALNMSEYLNGVAKRHRQVSQEMFPGYPIDSVTNGIHSASWTSHSFAALYDRYIPGWRNDPFALRHAISISPEEIWEAHLTAKRCLIDEVNRRASASLSPDALTIGFGRRATPYKRADLILSEPHRLEEIAAHVGPLQVIFAGKAHPRDFGGKDLIRRIMEVAKLLKGKVPIIYLANYDMVLGHLMTAGTDVWLNTPLRPLEASGTSGMKAAHNGIPSFSVLDGWWIEGHIEGVTGWAIGPKLIGNLSQDQIMAQERHDLYDKLAHVIAPMYYEDREQWCELMRKTIGINASFFNAHRMVQQYAANAYV